MPIFRTSERGARRLSLRARLVWSAALSTAAVVGAATYVEVGIIERSVESEARDAASATALGVAADLTERDDLPTAGELEDLRIDFMRAVPNLRALTVTRIEGQTSVIDTTTEASLASEILPLARHATQRREPQIVPDATGRLRFVAVPLEREHRPYGAVVVTVSMEMLEGVRRQARFAALVLVPAAILILTGLIDLLARGLVHRPLGQIHETMRKAAGGDHEARAPVDRNDELGELAVGLNTMLERLGDFNAALQQEVHRATEALRDRHRQVLEGNQRLFAARRDLARSEQLAVTGRMAASVAHQIGTPLNLISGYVQMILQDLAPDDTVSSRLRTVQAQIGKVTTIVQGLLDQARTPVLRKTPTAPADLLSSACELARPTLEAAGIQLETRLERQLPIVDADVGQLEQAFLNLITNSIDAMPEGGALTVSVRGGGGQVEFSFTDTGSGIAEADLPRVFDPLYTTKRPGKGTGLGLAIVRDVVAAHGGSVSLASTPGHGTTAVIRLPRSTAVEEAHA